jgi:D-glycero-D-manno-heptose 1,7-bisphosphate phosphatase
VKPGRVNRQARPGVVLLDRDGTIIEDPGYLDDPGRLQFLPGAVEGLRQLAAGGFRLVVITNQSGIGRGALTEQQVADVHQRLREELTRSGVALAGIYHCPHRPGDGCSCRKPATGLVDRAAAELGFPRSESVVVGDKASDIGLARALGVPAFLVLTGEGRATAAAQPGRADYVVGDLTEVARIMTESPLSAWRPR